MTTITIQADEEILATLTKIAKSRLITTEALLKEAITSYLQTQVHPSKKYSFIGIGRSGKKDISTQVEEKLAQGANRREGWSLPE